MPPPLPQVDVVITTHTTRHLRRTLLGVARQRCTARTVVVSCDVNDPAIAELCRAASVEFSLPLTVVLRTHQDECRISQVRNNGMRALLSLHGPAGGAHVLYLDGDCCPGPDVVALHQTRAAAGAELLVGYRVDLTEAQTLAFDEARVARAEPPVDPTRAQLDALAVRHRRYVRHLLLRRVGLVKAHKPKVLSAHFSVSWRVMLAVNGFDEGFTGYGAEDDDFSRRVHDSGARAGIVVGDAIVYHQWHPTRAPGRWKDAVGVERFHRRLPWRCQLGIDNPSPQPEPVVIRFEAGSEITPRPLASTNA